jgi:uncharacterized protein YcbK (DUF882 family)
VTWNFPNFRPDEFECQHCGASGIDQNFVAKLQELRNLVNIPLKISSGYRCKDHPIEKKKEKPGTHSEGIACDILCSGADAYKILDSAFELKFTGIGVNMRGNYAQRFIHLDTSTKQARPNIWSY